MGSPAVKWLLAVVGLALVVILAVPAAFRALRTSVEVSGEQEATTAPANGGDDEAAVLEAGRAAPIVDAAVQDGTVRGLASEQISVGGEQAQAFLLAFPLIAGDSACLGDVVLEVQLLEAVEGEMGVYASGAFDPATLTEGGSPEGAVLPGGPATLAFTDGTPGRLRWDVTVLYRQWVQGGPIGDGLEVPAAAPFTVGVRPTDAASVTATFAAREAGEEVAPSITWSVAAGCGADG